MPTKYEININLNMSTILQKIMKLKKRKFIEIIELTVVYNELNTLHSVQ